MLLGLGTPPVCVWGCGGRVIKLTVHAKLLKSYNHSTNLKNTHSQLYRTPQGIIISCTNSGL